MAFAILLYTQPSVAQGCDMPMGDSGTQLVHLMDGDCGHHADSDAGIDCGPSIHCGTCGMGVAIPEAAVKLAAHVLAAADLVFAVPPLAPPNAGPPFRPPIS
jgi:hypothetical protein